MAVRKTAARRKREGIRSLASGLQSLKIYRLVGSVRHVELNN